MRNVWHFLLLAVAGLALMVFSPPLLSQAKEITNATGLDADSAVITDNNGNVLSHTEKLYADEKYRVDYNWTLPDSTRIQAGDTMSLTIPSNVYAYKDFNSVLKAANGATIGSLSLPTGSNTATITFNNYFASHNIKKYGFIWFKLTGTTPREPTPEPQPQPNKKPITMSKTAAWSDPDDPTTINWNIQVKHNDNKLVNPVITDTLSAKQTYKSGSVKATDAAGTDIPVTATTTASTDGGSVIHFKLAGTFNSDLSITYQTTTEHPAPRTLFQNQASYHDDEDNNADATAEIESPAADVNPGTPSEPAPEKKPISMTKTAAWEDPNDKSKINWTLEISHNGHQLVKPTITDTLSSNHTYVPDSVLVTAERIPIPVTVTVNGQQIIFKIDETIDADLTVTYQTQAHIGTTEEVYDNSAVFDDEDGNHAEATDNIILTPADKPGTEQPGTELPGTEQPGTEQPGTELPGTEQPGTELPGTEQPGTEQPGTELPGTEQPGTEQPGTEQPGTEQPGTQEPEPEKPDTEQPGTQEPEPEKPDTEQPGTQEPEPEKPDTEQPTFPNENDEMPTLPTPGQPVEPEKPTPEQPSVTAPTEPKPSYPTVTQPAPVNSDTTEQLQLPATTSRPYQPHTVVPNTMTTGSQPVTTTTPADNALATGTPMSPSAAANQATLPQTNEQPHALISLLAILGGLLTIMTGAWLHRKFNQA